MENKNYIGDSFIGQTELKQTINFLLDGYSKQEEKKFFDNILFVAQRGDGKTLLCRKIGECLKKTFIEINGSSLNSITAFVDRIVIPHISNNQDVTLFIDEIAAVHPKVLEWFLSMLQYDSDTKTSFAIHDGVKHEFNFNHLTVLAATTNPEKLPKALKSRFRELEFAPYKNEELKEILKSHTLHVHFQDDTDTEIVNISRGSPRQISLRLSEDIKKYLYSHKKINHHVFDRQDWLNFKNILSIRPFGLKATEEKLLKILSEAPCTVTCLTGKFNMDMGTLRKEIELYPLSLGLITINQKRQITAKGLDVLNTIKLTT